MLILKIYIYIKKSFQQSQKQVIEIYFRTKEIFILINVFKNKNNCNLLGEETFFQIWFFS